MRLDLIAIVRWTFAGKKAREDYYATPTEFNKRIYCTFCSRTPRADQGCDACNSVVRMRRLRKQRAA